MTHARRTLRSYTKFLSPENLKTLGQNKFKPGSFCFFNFQDSIKRKFQMTKKKEKGKRLITWLNKRLSGETKNVLCNLMKVSVKLKNKQL